MYVTWLRKSATSFDAFSTRRRSEGLVRQGPHQELQNPPAHINTQNGHYVLIYHLSMVLWLAGNNFVGKLSDMGQPTRITQPSIPPGLRNE